MRHERAQLIEQGRYRKNRSGSQQRCPAEPEHAADQRPGPQHAAQLLPEDTLRDIAFGRPAAEFGIDRERGGTLPHELADRRQDRTERYEQAEAHDQPDRREQRNQHEQRQAPRLHQRERQVLRVLDGAVLRTLVVQRVHAFVHERRHQQRDADQQVPAQPKTRQRVLVNMRELMDEHQRAVEGERTDDAESDLRQRPVDQDRGRNRSIAEQR